MRAFVLICERCDAREPLGGNPQARLNFLIASGWHFEPRGKDYCPLCWKKMQTERQPRSPI
jgi:hypothetical protein